MNEWVNVYCCVFITSLISVRREMTKKYSYCNSCKPCNSWKFRIGRNLSGASFQKTCSRRIGEAWRAKRFSLRLQNLILLAGKDLNWEGPMSQSLLLLLIVRAGWPWAHLWTSLSSVSSQLNKTVANPWIPYFSELQWFRCHRLPI